MPKDRRFYRLSMSFHWFVLSSILALTASPTLAEQCRYELDADPAPGFNLISWANFAEGATIWENAVQAIYDNGFREVSINPVRFVDEHSGAISSCDQRMDCPPNAHIEAAVRRARSLGMTITLNPFVEPNGFSVWRGEMNFTGEAKEQFWRNYQSYLTDIAMIAQTHGVDRLSIGTELNALVEDQSNNSNWIQLIDAVDSLFNGQLGYAANWNDYQNSNLTQTIWEHPKIDFLGVDAYHPLVATPADAQGFGEPSISVLKRSWQSILNDPNGGFAHGILAFAAERKGGMGMPVVLTEHGICALDKATVEPFNFRCPNSSSDLAEQHNDYLALMYAADGLRARPPADGQLDAIHIWHWKMAGAEGSQYALDPFSATTMVLRNFVGQDIQTVLWLRLLNTVHCSADRQQAVREKEKPFISALW